MSTLVAGTVVALAFWLRVFSLARLARSGWTQVHALVLALASPTVLWLAVAPDWRMGPSSLEFMFSLPLPGMGWPWGIGELFVELRYGLHPILWLLVLFHVLMLVTLIQLLLMLMRARREARAALVESSGASSRP